jgi:membrane associated rhomboid family serine protease
MYGNSIWGDIKWQFRFGSDLIKLILINIAVFLIVNLVKLIFLFAQQPGFDVVSYLWLHSDLKLFLRQPWGLLTYMFVQENFWHIFWNMLGLYWFGQILQDMIGKSKIVPLYLFGGIFGGLLYMLVFNMVPLFNSIVGGAVCIGASAAVMAIVVAAATIAPNYELILFLIGPVKIKWIALVYVLLDLINIQNGNAGGHISHLGGAMAGFIYIRLLQNGKDPGRIYYGIADFFSGLFRKKKKIKIEYKREYASTYSRRQGRQTTSIKDEKDMMNKQERLDAILDKINRSSYDSLSKEEKDFLFKISQEKD